MTKRRRGRSQSARSSAGKHAFPLNGVMPVEPRRGRKVDGGLRRALSRAVTNGSMQEQPAAVPARVIQAGERRARWAWAEGSIWTDRMPRALEEGVKGGVWFSLIDTPSCAAGLNTSNTATKPPSPAWTATGAGGCEASYANEANAGEGVAARIINAGPTRSLRRWGCSR